MKKYLFIILLLLLLSSCKKNPIAPESNNAFSLQLNIIDNNGNHVPNINVSIQSKYDPQIDTNNINPSITLDRIADIPKNFKLSQNFPNPFYPSTIVQYAIPQSCFANLLLYNLEGQEIEIGLSSYQNAGYHRYDWNMFSDSSNQALMIKLIASSDSTGKQILFQDSIYIMIFPSDLKAGFVGKTNSEGNLIIKNKLFFPHFFNLPSIPITGPDSPEPIGLFTYSDTVKITLSNESFSKSISYDEIIKNGTNNYTLKWTDTTQKTKIGN